MGYRVALITTSGDRKVMSTTVETKKEAEDWLLEKASEFGLKKAKVVNTEDANDCTIYNKEDFE